MLPPNPPRVLYLGIDPGTTTGLALADGADGRLVSVASAGPLATVRHLDALAREHAAGAVLVRGVWIEDSRPLPIYARNRNANRGERDRIARAVGHTDLLTGFYADLCASHGWAVALVEPKRVAKWDADTLRRLAGWEARTNEHGRDAARLVFGRTSPPPEARTPTPSKVSADTSSRAPSTQRGGGSPRQPRQRCP
ncbi:hypothetical protein BSZ36_14180 [Rubricoccus marinus]|uniref:YqgF/RNase H-like domain-containing protein n=2 Tax=Rubricoccus marinus TaxID=716817 RepID=A0A259U249_9BACT|nr:hypothetical protein BSZ36_14180 [Rubricoccus marinus]